MPSHHMLISREQVKRGIAEMASESLLGCNRRLRAECTLCRSWFRKMIVQLHLEALPAIFLSAWLMSRACAPTV